MAGRVSFKGACTACGELVDRRDLCEERIEYRALHDQSRYKTRKTGRILCKRCVREEIGEDPADQGQLL